jgi:hypothetical protein
MNKAFIYRLLRFGSSGMRQLMFCGVILACLQNAKADVVADYLLNGGGLPAFSPGPNICWDAQNGVTLGVISNCFQVDTKHGTGLNGYVTDSDIALQLGQNIDGILGPGSAIVTAADVQVLGYLPSQEWNNQYAFQIGVLGFTGPVLGIDFAGVVANAGWWRFFGLNGVLDVSLFFDVGATDVDIAEALFAAMEADGFNVELDDDDDEVFIALPCGPGPAHCPAEQLDITSPTGNGVSEQFSNVPEPTSLALLGSGVLALGGVLRKRLIGSR